MKKLIVLFLFLIGYCFSQNDLEKSYLDFVSYLGKSYNPISLILSNFFVFLILFLSISIALLVIGYFGASFFDIPEIKVLIKTEIGQLFVTSILITTILGVILFLDQLIINSSNFLVSPCPSNYIYNKDIPRYMEYSNCYLDTLIKLTDNSLKVNLKESIEAGRETFFSRGSSMNIWDLGYQESSRPAAFKRLDVEIKTTEGQFLSSFLISLLAQKAFLNFIAPVFGPFLIFIGVLFRTLFVTRRLGGLLIAIGIGLFLIWPLTYLISWFTFRGAIFGSQGVDQNESICPKECDLNPPIAYNTSINPAGIYMPSSFISYYDLIQLIEKKSEDEKNKDKDLYEYLLSQGIQPCFVEDEDEQKVIGKIKVADSKNCPEGCRFLPTDLKVCNETACNNLPHACKFIRAMGLENYTSYYESNDMYCSNPSNCRDCPISCKYRYPEIDYSKSFSPVDKNSIGITTKVPKNSNSLTTNRFECAEKCKDCPSVCRVYTKLNDGKIELVFKNKVECKNCQDCLNYRDSSDLPICMFYSPLEASDSCTELCGLPLSIRNLRDSGNSNVCPLDCRLYFDENSKEYKDPIFEKYCEEGMFSKACNRCPNSCKINVSKFLNSVYMDYSICSPPPKFSNGKITDENLLNCIRCPPSCRFLNPSSIAKIAIDTNNPLFAAFYSKSFLIHDCHFDPSRYIECTSYNSQGYYENCQGYNLYAGTKVPSISPVRIAYQSLKDEVFCPDFLARDSRFVFLNTWNDDQNSVRVKSNPFVSIDCTLDKDVQKFCSSPFCRAQCFILTWPKFATLLDISNRYSRIDFSISNCNFDQRTKQFYDNNYTLLVVLNYSSSYYLPKGVDSSYFPSLSALNSNPANLENFACYPILSIPSSSQRGFEMCGEYIESNSKDRAMINGSACPYSCRYDELKNLNLVECGNFTLKFESSNPSHNCDPFCNGLIRSNDLSYCQNEAYSCNQLRGGNYWVRIDSIPLNKSHSNPLCNKSIVVYNSTTYRRGDTKPDGTVAQNHWWEDYCSYTQQGQRLYINFSLELGYQPYNCSPGSKYAGLDYLIAASGYSDYRECGTIDTNANPNYVFCGNYSINYGGRSVVISAINPICFASYNARAMPGLAFHNVVDTSVDFSTKVGGVTKQTIKSDDNCQLCPVVYRIFGLDPSKGSLYFILSGLNCDKCFIKVNPSSSSQSCAIPSKKAIGCPIRCRIDPSLLDNQLSYGCDPEGKEKSLNELIENVDYSCDDFHAKQCRIFSFEKDPCEGCIENCKRECQYLPYVRQDCDICSSSGGVSLSNLLNFATSAEGLYTQTGWIRIGLLLIPSIILPSFSIVILLSFIRSTSIFLGGDIEIPGLFKLI
ncbi:MAG: hypothetical protein QXG16_04360 [Candidatus Anstonellaceae archaeon]